MDLNNIYELWDRFDASDVVEMELEMQGVRFSLKTAQASPAQSEFFSENSSQAGKAISVGEKNLSKKNISQEARRDASDELDHSKEEKAASAGKKEGIAVKAPLVGTFYQAPSPDAEPFVKVGQEVHKGDVIGIIEAMKLMNDVLATADGVVQEILAEDGTMVEYDQVLITIA
ncbi:MAG: acetyl-CoA carboxylase biotin carboxyl carrier protein [Eubacteriales bacterium]|nr:acetyl-CoA carboxylase biotin carboxyl carrier protein [Eubacteriales bacterium]